MSKEYEGQDPLVLAQQAERDLNSYQKKQGINDPSTGTSGSSTFPLATLSFSYIHHMEREQSRADIYTSTAEESGIDTNATTKYPGATVRTGASASGREIAPDEGGDIISRPGEKGGSGRVTKDVDFEGEGGPETKQRLYEQENPGNDDVESNVNQKKKPEGDTVPTNFGGNIVGKQM